MNLCSLQSKHYIKIALELPIPELLELCQTNRDYEYLCNSEEFWQKRLQKDYTKNVWEKPDNLSYKDYYHKLYNCWNVLLSYK